jgi:hypothetical protein
MPDESAVHLPDMNSGTTKNQPAKLDPKDEKITTDVTGASRDATGGGLGFDVHPRASRDATGGGLGFDVHPRASRDATGGGLGFDVHPRVSRDATSGK